MSHPLSCHAVLAVGVAVLLAPSARAATDLAPVRVTIVQPLQMSATQEMDFGTIAPPSEGVQTFHLDEITAVVTPGVGSGSASGEALLAEFSVTGEPDRALDMSAEVTQDFGDSAISLTGLQISGSGTFDGNGQATIRVGGILSVDASAAPATHGDAVVTVTVNYQ